VSAELKAYQDPDHPGNRLRPRVRCVGCRKLGCITAWGPWCFECNVERMDRIGASLRAEIERLEAHPKYKDA
jgi:hypothetical protein